MNDLPTLLSIAAVWGIAAATPGPNFFVTLRGVMAQPQGKSRGHGFAAVGGIVATAWMTRNYERAAHLIDRLAGGIFLLFGAKLALDR
ncbi:hypothetical protein [Pelagibius marinus]|uniref:hypothetical protein n=1 Tax=Pelagibius marinus TaxID=2762760 RepID=UPI001872F304|nr:hypothetical protein [Pelagibius marinus]